MQNRRGMLRGLLSYGVLVHVTEASDAGSVVYCEKCHLPIEEQRLAAQPGTRFHAACHPDGGVKAKRIKEPIGTREAFKAERRSWRSNSRG
jgi:Prokaryotic dksA/traR C4-type zinc finger